MTSTLALIPLPTTTLTATITPNPSGGLPQALLLDTILASPGAVLTDPSLPGPLTLGFADLYDDQTTYRFQTLTAGEAVETGYIGPVTPTAVATLTGSDVDSLYGIGMGTTMMGQSSGMVTSGVMGGGSTMGSGSVMTSTTSAAAVPSATGGVGHVVVAGGMMGLVGMVGAVVALL